MKDEEAVGLFIKLRELIDQDCTVPKAQQMKRIVTQIQHVMENLETTIETNSRSQNYV